MRDEARELLRRIVKYAREDRATTPGVTRLERVLAETERFLARASEPEQATEPPFTPLPPGFFHRLENQLRRASDGSIPGICESPLDGIGEPEDIAEAKEPTT